MVISEENYAMLLTEDKMRQFTPRPIADATKSTEVIICLSCDAKEECGTHRWASSVCGRLASR